MRQRLIIIFFLISIGLNVFLLAASASLLILQDHLASSVSPQRASLRSAASVLAQPYRAAFENLLKNEGETIQPENRLSRSIREQVWISFDSTIFDATYAKTELARARMLNLASRGKVEDAVVDFAAGLPIAQREALGQAMAQSLKRRKLSPVTVKRSKY